MTTKNELSTEVKAKEIHENASIYYSRAEFNLYKHVMEIKKIRDEKYYRELGYETFDNYCQKEWGVKRDVMYQRIQIAERLSEDDFVDFNLQFGHSKTLLLTRMTESQREQSLGKGVPTEEGYKTYDKATQKEINEYRRNAEKSNKKAQLAEQAKQQAEKQAEQARKSEQIAVSQLEELENKEPEVVEKTVVKEVDHTDYKAMDLLQKERDSLERRYELLKDKVDLMESDIAESKSIKDEIASLHNSKEHIVKRMEAIEETAEYYAEIEHMLKNKLAPINYSRSLRELKDEPNVQENLNKIADMVIEWGQNLQKEISSDYVDVEIIG